MDKIKEVGDLITAVNSIARACKDAFAGVKAYQRYPLRLIYSLAELHAETVQLRSHVTTLDNLTAELCAACILCPKSDVLAETQASASSKEGTDGKITA